MAYTVHRGNRDWMVFVDGTNTFIAMGEHLSGELDSADLTTLA